MDTAIAQRNKPRASVKGRLQRARAKSLSKRLEPGETIVTWKLPEGLKKLIDDEAAAERRGINDHAIVILERYFAGKAEQAEAA